MKRILSMIFAVAICLTLFAGCKNNASNSNEAKTDAAQETASQTQAQSLDNVEYVPGTRTDTEYVNNVLGFKFDCGDKYTMASDDELDELMNAGVDIAYEDSAEGKKMVDYAKINSIYEMSAFNASDNTSVMVMAEKLQLKSMTEGQYISALKSQYENTKLEVKYNDVSETNLCDVTYKSLSYEVTAETGSYKQTMLIKKVGNRMVVICLTYTDDDKLNDIMTSFTKISNQQA